MDRTTLKVGDKVEVLWIESGNVFKGIVKAISDSLPPLYDVLYDDLVRGKLCLERNIAGERISSVLNLTKEECIEIPSDNTLDKKLPKKTNKKPKSSYSKLLQRIGEIDILNEENFEEFSTSTSIIQLYNEIQSTSIEKCFSNSSTSDDTDTDITTTSTSLVTSDALQINKIYQIFSSFLMKDVQFNLIDVFLDSIQTIKDTPDNWLNSPKSLGYPQFASMKGSLSSSNIILQMLTISKNPTAITEFSSINTMNNMAISTSLPVVTTTTTTIPSSDSLFDDIRTLVSEECFDRAIAVGISAIKNIYGDTTTTTSTISQSGIMNTATGSGSSSKKEGNIDMNSKKSTATALRKLIVAVSKEILPLISTLLTSLKSLLLQQYKQTDRTCLHILELCVTALKFFDPAISPRIELLNNSDSKSTLLALSIQKLSISVLQSLFRYYPLHRACVDYNVLDNMNTSSGSGSTSIDTKSNMTTTTTTNTTASTLPTKSNTITTTPSATTPSSDKKRSKSETDGHKLTTEQTRGRKKRKTTDVEGEVEVEVAVTEGSKVHQEAVIKPTATASALALCNKESVRYCAGFIQELFQRCQQKEVGSEYRLACSNLIRELLVVISCPSWPNKKENSAMNMFLLDLIGTLGSGCRQYILQSEYNQHMEEDALLSTDITIAIARKINMILPEWQNIIDLSLPIENENDNNIDMDNEKIVRDNIISSKIIKIKSTSKNKSKNKNKHSSEDTTTTTTTKSMQMGNEIKQHRYELLEGHAASKVIGDLLRNIAGHSTGISDNNNNIPGFRRLLMQCCDAVKTIDSKTVSDVFSGQLATIETVSTAMGVSTEDFYEQTVYHHLQASSTHGGEHIFDALLLNLASWHKDLNTTTTNTTTNAAVTAPTKSTATSSNTNKAYNTDNNIEKMNISKKIYIESLSKSIITTGKQNIKQHTNNSTDSKVDISDLIGDSWRTNLTLEWTQSKYISLLCNRYLYKGFENILRILILLLSDTQPLLRARVIKTLAILIKSDPSLSSRKEIRDAVAERFNDVSISVRDESVRLVGSFIMSGYDIGDDYLDGLLVRLRDKGVSVRKAVVNILRDILLHQPTHPSELLSRGWLPKEEDTIKDVVRTTFEQLWFTPPPLSISHTNTNANANTVSESPVQIVEENNNINNNIIISSTSIEAKTSETDIETNIETTADVPTPPVVSSPIIKRKQSSDSISISTSTTPTSTATNPTKHLESTAIQMINVLARASSSDWMIHMVRGILHSKSDGEEAKRQLKTRREQALIQCERIVSILVDILLQTEVNRADSCSVLSAKGLPVVAIIGTIAVFCE
eukprot:gene1962-3810_t